MSVIGIDRVTYGVKDLETARKFWTDFGLTPAETGNAHLAFTTQNGATVEVRQADDASLPPPVGADVDATVREATFGVSSADDLQRLAAELSKDREVTEDADGAIHAVDPVGFGVCFRPSTTHKVVAPEQDVNVPGRATRINRRGRMYDHASPIEISHIVYMTDDLDAHREFYVDRLGFRVTDAYPGRGYFTRCDGAHNHHNLFLLDPGIGKRSFHHLAFEVGTIHELFGGGNNMTRNGWDTMLGPGRHPISSCYFWYFRNPCGGAAEYDFDSDVIDENWQPAEFESTPANFAEWCLAEGMGEALLYKGIQRG